MEHSTAAVRTPRTVAELRTFLNNGHDVARIEFFSDAVFAIAITLLALEIKIPELEHHAKDGEILHALAGLGRILFSYVFSFVLIGTQWVRHHALFRLIRRHDPVLLALNLFGLMLVTLVPLPTELYGDHISSTAAVAVFYAYHAVNALVWLAMWSYASHKNKLVDPDLPPSVIRHVTWMQSIQMLGMTGGCIAVLCGGALFAAWGLLGGFLVARVWRVWLNRQERAAA